MHGGKKEEGRRKKEEKAECEAEILKGEVAMEGAIVKKIRSFRDLKVYEMAFETAMEIFELTKDFPKEERYSLIDQIRRSSRSVCSNLAEAWRKRKYTAVFINKLTDASQEAAETQTWLEFSLRCKYLNEDYFKNLDNKYEQIFAMLFTMDKQAQSFCK